MSLIINETREQLERVLEFLSSQPNFYDYLPFTNTIRIQLGCGFPPAVRVYLFEKNESKYYMMHREYKVVISHNWVASVGTAIKEDVFEALELFNKEVGIFTDKQLHLFAATYEITEWASEFHQNKCPDTKTNIYPCHRYYMSNEQKELLVSTELPTLPEGYELGTISDSECDILVKNWRHSEANELQHTRRKVKYLPSSAIRYKGQLVGHEIVDGTGIMTNQFVDPEHRGRGLGNILEMDISKKLIGMGLDATKHVELYNKTVIEMTNRSKFWTIAKKTEKAKTSVLFTILNEAVSHVDN